jgi:hypothetical protein
MGTIACALLAAALGACGKGAGATPPAGKGRVVFEDRFDRAEIGPEWLDTGGGYTIVNGELRVQGAHNKPLWLKRKLPRDARVELKARSMSPAVDIKVELFGDGASKAIRASYTATSYVLILGGWSNSRSIIARMNEHGDDRKVRTEPRGEQGRSYAFSITRKGGRLEWLVDGEAFLALDDPEPLAGPGHDSFAFNDWESEVYFDDLVVYEP